MSGSFFQSCLRAAAMSAFQQDQASWGRTIGQGEAAVEWQGRAVLSLRQMLMDRYMRLKMAAI